MGWASWAAVTAQHGPGWHSYEDQGLLLQLVAAVICSVDVYSWFIAYAEPRALRRSAPPPAQSLPHRCLNPGSDIWILELFRKSWHVFFILGAIVTPEARSHESEIALTFTC